MPKINFSKLGNPRDREVLRLASLGRPVSYIAAVTRYTPAQVMNRLKRGRTFKLKDIRSGNDKYQLLNLIEHNEVFRRQALRKIDSVLSRERVVINGTMQGIPKEHDNGKAH